MGMVVRLELAVAAVLVQVLLVITAVTVLLRPSRVLASTTAVADQVTLARPA
jgi:hypothetical protein